MSVNGSLSFASITPLVNGVQEGSSVTKYFSPDHLGSTNLASDKDGNLTSFEDYYAFGRPRVSLNTINTSQESRQYIGKEYDETLGLSYLEARYYDSSRGSFLSLDPASLATPDKFLTDPQQLNLYSYARNNPIILSDPTGNYVESGIDIAFLIYDVKSAYSDFKNGNVKGGVFNSIAGVGDVAGLALPGATGVGLGTKGALHAGDAALHSSQVTKATELLKKSGKEILEQSEKLGGHGIERHVAKTVDEMRQRAPTLKQLKDSSFETLSGAGKAAKQLVQKNWDKIEDFATNSEPTLRITETVKNASGWVYDAGKAGADAFTKSSLVRGVLQKTEDGKVYFKTIFPTK